MAQSNEDWISDSNNALEISLVKASAQDTTDVCLFNPKMTYSIFGEEEQVFGYKGLRIRLRFNAHDMRPNLQILYNRKFKAVGETEATDVKAALEDFLPKTAFESTKVFQAAISDPSHASWKPPGELWESSEVKGETHEIWKGNLADLAVQQLVKRVGIMIPLFIEGGTLLDMEDTDSLDRWTVFFLYQKKSETASLASPYTFMGYATVYRYFFYQPVSPTDPIEKKQREEYLSTLSFELSTLPSTPFETLPCRSRISQFIVLPPFQGGGNGSRFYASIFSHYLADTSTKEITVEDPNEAFDDLRDLNDLARLRKNHSFNDLKINTSLNIRQKGVSPANIVDTEAISKLRKSMKIAPRQFLRVTEINLLSRLPEGVRASLLGKKPAATGAELRGLQHEYHLWQLWVKTRLYKHNKDMLIQLDRVERIDKLEQALGGVEADYARLLRAFETRWCERPVGDDDEEEEDAEEENGLSVKGLGKGAGSKRPSAAPESGSEAEEDEELEQLPRAKKTKFT